ncbi:hypothetical protein YC2023_065599 [Brassica napus]
MGFMCLLRLKYIFSKKLYTKPRKSGRCATIPIQSTVNKNSTVLSKNKNEEDINSSVRNLVFGSK